ncbi:MAG: hypothetical protein KA053_09000 [Lentimicrobiaceae bacterium]|jgi:hypothetical protein|nr:hypothetical protein [Lentimicrobiaceae bacterium]
MNPVIKGPLYKHKNPAGGFIEEVISGALGGVIYGGKNAKAQKETAKAQKEIALLSAKSHEKTMETIKYVAIAVFAIVVLYLIFKS